MLQIHTIKLFIAKTRKSSAVWRGTSTDQREASVPFVTSPKLIFQNYVAHIEKSQSSRLVCGELPRQLATGITDGEH